jgi:hypothetical protein
MTNEGEIRERILSVRERIETAARRAGRSPDEVVLLAVTKTVEPQRIMIANGAGITHFGENRVQEAERKLGTVPPLRETAIWHFIGRLQTNKVRKAVALFNFIQSIDRIELAERVDQVSRETSKPVPVFLEVDVGLEPTKSGIRPDELVRFSERISGFQYLRPVGLMAIPPYFEDPEQARPYFSKLRELLEGLNKHTLFEHQLKELSMGMSHDFEVAIEEGATLVRVGTAIFGPRPI